MKGFSMLVWLTQLGLSVALPLAGFIWLGLWLKDSCGWGGWVTVVSILLGIFFAVDGLINSLKLMSRMSKDTPKEAPGISYNEHE